ncbi:glycosyltransferase family 4 protein [Bacteroidia bacterium]|nr:glycosyltransferase family 4 protein [Bacteroidia bacterium]
MKIGFDAKRYFNNQTGLGNYSRWLIDGVSQNPNFECDLYTPKKTVSKLTNIHYPKGLNRFIPSLWRSKFICSDLRKNGVKLYHGLSNELPFGIHKTGIKTVVTIHDLINKRYPEYYNAIDLRIYDEKLRYAQRAADIIVVPSEQTKRDLIKYYHTAEERIQVIPLSIPPRRKYAPMEFAYDKEYMLCVSGFSKRKNLVNLVSAYIATSTDLHLVIAGKKGDSYAEIANLCSGNEKIQLMTDVSSDTLGLLYDKAQFCIYPSVFEGFGIPILEAFSYGKTVATSNTSSIPEVGGDAVQYFDPISVQSISKVIVELLKKDKRSLLESKIESQLENFDNNALISRYSGLYEEILNS